MLFEKFSSFLSKQEWIQPSSRILLAVSGGIDSMTMACLFHRFGGSYALAHCNFQLRGSESDEDELFVRQQAEKLHMELFVTRFDTTGYAAGNKLSIQMAARELRYSWFDSLIKKQGFDFIAVAHNRDDSLETFFINLGRGTGIAGLTGIPSISGNIIRPLIFASRSEIEQYVTENHILFREDSSNSSDKYKRNYIRHKIIPGLENVFPNFRESHVKNMERLTDACALYQHSLNLLIPSVVKTENNVVYIDIPTLVNIPGAKTVLYEILKNYGFSSAMMDEIYLLINAGSGKQVFSTTHQLVKDRNHFVVSKPDAGAHRRFYIEEGTVSLVHPVSLLLEAAPLTDDFIVDKDADIAQVDYNKLDFPLILRKWQPGDYFVPLGMKGIKKLSDFFVDSKLSIVEKDNTWLLASGDQIVWIVGKRIDDRFKITKNTTKILRIKKVK